MTLTQLRYLVAIADAGLNITLAAARVHATQPGLSKQIKQLVRDRIDPDRSLGHVDGHTMPAKAES